MKIAAPLPAIVMVLACSSGRTGAPPPTSPDSRSGAPTTAARETRFIDSLVSVMTLEEKAGQLTMSFADEGSSLDLRALTIGQHYYFGIESFDENGVSALSHVVRID